MDSNGGIPKGISGHDHLSRVETAATVNMSMEMFEKMYLSPENRVKGELRGTFANPTPLALVGFLIASTPLACELMGWRGAGGGGAGTIGAGIFFGGMLQIIGAMLEWVIGNSFPFVVFGTFGSLYLALAVTQIPFYNAEAAFTANATTAAEKAAGIASFNASLGFFFLSLGILIFMFFICTFRINILFVVVFFLVDLAVFLLTGSYFKAALGDSKTAEKLTVIAGAIVFVYCLLTWYLLAAQLLRTVDFPFDLPVGDLSSRVPSKKKLDARANREASD